MTLETLRVSHISRLPKGGQVKISRTSVNGPIPPRRNNECNNPSEIQSTACGADREIAYLRGNMI